MEITRELTETFSALANETRLQIVAMMADDEIQCSEILAQIDLSQPAISYHLGRLERAGIVIKEKHGAKNCYRLRNSIRALVQSLMKEEK